MGDISIDPQVIIILVVLIFGAIRWAIEQFRKTHLSDDEEEQEGGPLSEFEDLYEEARRKIAERQGRLYPEDEEIAEKLEEYSARPSPPPVPPPLPGTRTPPPAPSFRAPEPAIYTAPDYSSPPPPVRVQLSLAEKAALERVAAGGLRTTRRRATPRSDSKVRTLLSSPTSTRDAIVLREILGPPKGME